MDLSLFITQEGMEKIQRRIHHLMVDERPVTMKALMIAREFGDLSENAEYKAAKEKQRQIDTEIDHLRRRSAHLKVVDSSAFPRDKVRFGLICHTRDIESGEETTYQVVGVDELIFYETEGIQPVSVMSPIGKALLSKAVGEYALVQAPMGERKLEILNIK
jgi:transcription elongation GreA/GreB family factor